MLGWHISIHRQAEGGSSPATSGSTQGARLACWQAGVKGLVWLDQLVEAGRAIYLGGAGYPSYYTAQAQHLVPPVVGGPPEARRTWVAGKHDVLTSKWEGRTVIDQAVADDCHPDEWLLVVAWDES